MPELPEVERAAKFLQELAKGRRITKVQTFEDSIVFSGISHQEFGNEVSGRVVTDAKRYGKVFYMSLDGEGRHPVLHFGMTGLLQVKGKAPMYYKEAPRKSTIKDEWPPKFTKFVLHLADIEGESTTVTEVAFLDARRLGRIRLCASPLTEPPISELGFDPILSMAPLETFSASIQKRSCPIKALLLNQSFSAGVGNWVADEILYHARVHPEQRCNTLSGEQIQQLHHNTVYVAQTAVDANADDSLFPENWLFKHRWGKGKKKKTPNHPLLLPSGQPATIKWITVGGRTSAYVIELQALPKDAQVELQLDADGLEGNESELTPLEESEEETPESAQVSRSKSKKRTRIRDSEPKPPKAVTRKRAKK